MFCYFEFLISKEKNYEKVKKIYKIVVSLLIIICLITLFAVSAIAEETLLYRNDIYVSSEFNGVPEDEMNFALKKQAAAEKYYQALVSGDEKSILQSKIEFNKLATPNTDIVSRVNNRAVTAPTSYRVDNLYHVAQEKSYYCGPAAAKMILANLGVTRTQTQLAGSSYLKTEQYGSTPWYIQDSGNYTHYPMLMTLRNCISESNGRYVAFIVSPMAPAGSSPLTVSQCKSYIVSTTSNSDTGVAIAGHSTTAANHQLPGYPNQRIGHWLVSDGYTSNGDNIWIIDPAANSSAISWSGSISRYYQISATLLCNYVTERGLVW